MCKVQFLDHFECANSTLAYFSVWTHFAHSCNQNIKCLLQKYVIWDSPHASEMSARLARRSCWQNPHLPWFDPSAASPSGVSPLQANSQPLMSSMTMWAGTKACLRCTRNWIFRQRSLLVHGHCRIPSEQMGRMVQKHTLLIQRKQKKRTFISVYVSC